MCCLVALVALVAAAPITSSQTSSLSAETLLQIAPNSASCAGAPKAGECRTASQALAPILQSFGTYQIASLGAQAAVLSTMAFETADFKYQRNYFPGNPGQGTRNMQSAAFNLKYAQSIPVLAPQIPMLQQNGPNGILNALVSNDAWDFGSAAWFLSTQCGPSVLTELGSGGAEGFNAYLACIGTTNTPDRMAYFQRAMTAFGL